METIGPSWATRPVAAASDLPLTDLQPWHREEGQWRRAVGTRGGLSCRCSIMWPLASSTVKSALRVCGREAVSWTSRGEG